LSLSEEEHSGIGEFTPMQHFARVTDQLEREILSRGLDDIIQLAEIVSVARFNVGIEDGAELFDVVARCLRVLVGQGLAVVGDVDDGRPPLTVTPWSGDAESIAERAIGGWKALGRTPNLGEICWLELTPEGRHRARELFPDA
jgi:hypothetical protein